MRRKHQEGDWWFPWVAGRMAIERVCSIILSGLRNGSPYFSQDRVPLVPNPNGSADLELMVTAVP